MSKKDDLKNNILKNLGQIGKDLGDTIETFSDGVIDTLLEAIGQGDKKGK